MKRLLLIMVILLMADCCYSCSNMTPSPVTTYTDERGLFSISYPLGWKTPPSSLGGDEVEKQRTAFYKHYDSWDFNAFYPGYSFWIFYAVSPSDSQCRASVLVNVQPSSELNGTLDKMVGCAKEHGYHELSRVNTMIDGRKAIVVDCESFSDCPGTMLRCVQMFTIAHTLLWQVSCYTDSQHIRYCKDDIYAIVGSLRVLK